MDETPEQLDRISIDAIHEAIMRAADNPKIDTSRIALIGGSKGAELALVMASHFPSIKCVVGIVPCNVTFPGLTLLASTSSWTLHQEEVPFVPVPWAAVPSLTTGDLRSGFEIMLEDQEAVEKAKIQVEKINGPILLVSATKDEMWPSTEMSNEVMERLKILNFKFPHKHIAIEGNHTAPLDHFDVVFDFLKTNFGIHGTTE
jgi:predicted peptidase